MEDTDAWIRYPSLRKWFDKLYLANTLGYNCGPSGLSPSVSSYYCVRPIYNLSGMGVGARKQWIQAGDTSSVEPGYFWCEWFDGTQRSITYKRFDDTLEQTSCFIGHRDCENLYRFKKWERCDFDYSIPDSLFLELMKSDFQVLNVEIIDDKIIELHFRDSPDPVTDEFIPIWYGEEYLVDRYTKIGYKWIESMDDANGYLPVHRLGFMVK